METYRIGDIVKVKSRTFLKNHDYIDHCMCVPEMLQFADVECQIEDIHVRYYGFPRYVLSCTHEYVWVADWFVLIPVINIETKDLQELLQI